MNFKQQQIFFGYSKISVLLLYIPFFIVQGFFNFDTTIRYKETASTTINKQVFNQKKSISFNSDKTKNKEGHIRLNKRFQAGNAPVVVPPILEITAYFITANLFYTYPDPKLSSSHFYVKKLRGPPAVV